MKKIVSGVGLAAVLTMGPIGIAHAQSNEAAQETQTNDDDSDKTGLWGLAGLLGLAGLAGLKRRGDRRDDAYRTQGGSTGTVR